MTLFAICHIYSVNAMIVLKVYMYFRLGLSDHDVIFGGIINVSVVKLYKIVSLYYFDGLSSLWKDIMVFGHIRTTEIC